MKMATTMKQVAEQLVKDWQAQGVALETMAQEFNVTRDDAAWAMQQLGADVDLNELARECVKVAQARLDD